VVRHPLRKAVLLAGAVAAGAAVRAVARQRPAVAPVPADLRNPILYLPLSVRDERTLRIGRSGFARMPSPVAPGVEVTPRTIPGLGGHTIDLFVYEPEGRRRPSGALLWMHGGGLVMGTATQAHETCSRLASEVGIAVVNVEYRLAPEHPFPAGLDDCIAALSWLHDHADELGVDPARVAVGGDSAGGGLAATLSQRARDTGGPPIALQLLVYPMLDDRTVLRSDGGTTLVWTPVSNRFAWTAYLGHPPSEADERPYAAGARLEDLSGLPPAWIGVGDIDLFHDEDVAYARRLEEAGVPCELHVVPGMYHGADAIAPTAATMREYRERLTDALRAAVG
jgi:acetyl esterase/lipase